MPVPHPAGSVFLPLRSPLACLPAIGLASLSMAGAASVTPTDGLWTAHVKPLLQENCFQCHGGAKQKGGLDLRTIEGILGGGESGPAIVPGSRAESLLFQLIQPGADPHMPPKGDPLTSEGIDFIGTWIDALAADSDGSLRADARGPGGSGVSPSSAGDPSALWSPPAGTPIPEAVDGFLSLAWVRDGIDPAPVCDDRAFVRRVFLDLAGRIPTRAEADAWLADPAPDKRARLVDRLLDSPEHARHFAELFNVALLGRETGDRGRRDQRESNRWLGYLREVFAANRPWDAVARELLTARDAEGTPLAGGGAWFLYEHREDYQEIARTVGPALFGRQVHCAQCHDHPLAPEIKQGHYWGLVAFFNRSYNVNGPDGPAVAERAAGGYDKFSNLDGESFDAVLAFLNGRTAEEPDIPGDADTIENYAVPPPEDLLKPLSDEEKKKRGTPEVERVPVPKFSRRAALAEAGLVDDPAFAAALVNRIWFILFGRGIVHPVDKMDSSHPASHPGLLKWLSDDFASGGYDIRRLIGGLALSRAYQRSSIPTAGPPPAPESFAVALQRPLTAEQLYQSMLVASGRTPDSAGSFPGIDHSRYRDAFVPMFPDVFAETYAPSPNRAMFLSNNPILDELLEPTDGGLTAQLLSLSSPAAVVHEAFRAVLLREPDSDELARSVEFLRSRTDRRRSAVVQLCWALITGSEFRFNH